MAKKNTKYGKIVDGKLIYAPNAIPATIKDETGRDVDVIVYNGSDELYFANGWKLIVADDYPQDGKTYEISYVVVDNEILIHWHEVTLPPSIDERVDAIESAIVEIADELWG